MGWYTTEKWHIIPEGDLREHIEKETCDCCPRIEFENNTKITIHNSFDGREVVEREIDNHIQKIKEEIMAKDKRDWLVTRIDIDMKTYGENKGKYVGTIRFENGESESFSFKLYPDMCNIYIKLLSSEIIESASKLGEKLLKSLEDQGLLEEQKDNERD